MLDIALSILVFFVAAWTQILLFYAVVVGPWWLIEKTIDAVGDFRQRHVRSARHSAR